MLMLSTLNPAYKVLKSTFVLSILIQNPTKSPSETMFLKKRFIYAKTEANLNLKYVVHCSHFGEV